MIKCRNCKSNKLKKIIIVGSQPLSGVFYKKKKFNLKKYPLDLYKCQTCKLIQLYKTAKSYQMFGNIEIYVKSNEFKCTFNLINLNVHVCSKS